jgi:2-polyprenyl-6-methoxyphenol hydroxylase-like FAD-dependent oxidoreductase
VRAASRRACWRMKWSERYAKPLVSSSPWPMRMLIEATREPFVQAIVDVEVPRMAHGRVALLGDAAFVPRPHTAASTSKAAANVLALVEALEAEPDVAHALGKWEPDQLQLGRYLRRWGQMLGDRSQFPDRGETVQW